MLKQVALAAALAVASVGAATGGHVEEVDQLALGMTLEDIEALSANVFGAQAELDHDRDGDPELSFRSACEPKAASCLTAEIAFTGSELGREAFLMTITRRFSKPHRLSDVLRPIKKRLGRESARLREDKGSPQILHVLWGPERAKLDALDTHFEKLDLLARSHEPEAALMHLEMKNGRVQAYTLMIMDPDRYERKLAHHRARSAEASAARVAGSVDAPETASALP